MALPFVGGPLDGQRVAHDMPITWKPDSLGHLGLVWRECVAEDEPVVPLDTPLPARGIYSEIIHRYIMMCRGEFLISNCWLEHVGATPL